MTILIHVDSPTARAVVHHRTGPGSEAACGAKGRASWTTEPAAVTCPRCRAVEKKRRLAPAVH